MEHDETNCSAVLVGASNSDLGFETTTKTTSGFISVFVSWVSRKTGFHVVLPKHSPLEVLMTCLGIRVLSSGLGLREASIAGSFRLNPSAFAQEVGNHLESRSNKLKRKEM